MKKCPFESCLFVDTGVYFHGQHIYLETTGCEEKDKRNREAFRKATERFLNSRNLYF